MRGQKALNNRAKKSSFAVAPAIDEDVLTIKECSELLSKFELPEERIIAIKNNVIGLVDGILNVYLEGFK